MESYGRAGGVVDAAQPTKQPALDSQCDRLAKFATGISEAHQRLENAVNRISVCPPKPVGPEGKQAGATQLTLEHKLSAHEQYLTRLANDLHELASRLESLI